MKRLLFSVLLFAVMGLTTGELFAEKQYTILGKVLDKSTNQPVIGATIRVVNTSKGTFTDKKGKFRLPFLEGENKIKISSLGYESATIEVNPSKKDTVVVALNVSAIQLGGVTVIGDIEVNELVRRAIDRKQENMKKIKTFKGLLYSKLSVEIGGNMAGDFGASSNSVSISAGSGGDANPLDKFKMVLMESFSNYYRDYEKNISFTEIVQRKQTANIDASNNIFAIGEFFNFYDESFNLINTEIITPLSKKAFSYYDFKFINRQVLDDRYVYEIEVKPSTKLYPLFEGTIKIVDRTYELIEVNLRPSENTAIKFLDSLRFVQKYVELQNDIWYPTYLETSVKMGVDVVKGFIDMNARATIVSVFSEAQANVPLPDSLYDRQNKTTVEYTTIGDNENSHKVVLAKDVDSSKTEFWEKNSLRELTPYEKKMYVEIDSLYGKDPKDSSGTSAYSGRKGAMDIDILNPYLDFNRVSAISIGLSPTIDMYFGNFRPKIKTKGYYSFGLKDFFGEAGLEIPLGFVLPFYCQLNASVYSNVNTFGTTPAYPRLLNTIAAALFHEDYYDFYRADGFKAGLEFNLFDIEGKANYRLERNFALDKTTNNSIFSKNTWRANPKAEEGEFQIVDAELSYSFYNSSDLTQNNKLDLTLKGFYGENKTAFKSFRGVEGELNFATPTFFTGYLPMHLKIKLEGGKSSDNTPLQMQFRQNSRLVVYSPFGKFISAPVDWYGGTEYYAAHIEHNFSDMWWRLLGLPLYEGRGIDLLVGASAGKYTAPQNSCYVSTKNDFYSEVGFGFSRIPIFISNIITLGTDFRWGVGNIGSGRFGWAITFSLSM